VQPLRWQRNWDGPTTIPMDVYRADRQVVLSFDLPGADARSIELTVEQNVLTVAARRAGESSTDRAMIISERPKGMLTRRLVLDDSVGGGQATASFDNGVLTVTIPLNEPAARRRIDLRTGSWREQAIPANSTPTPAVRGFSVA
jgi:HSP20 family protein